MKKNFNDSKMIRITQKCMNDLYYFVAINEIDEKTKKLINTIP